MFFLSLSSSSSCSFILLVLLCAVNTVYFSPLILKSQREAACHCKYRKRCEKKNIHKNKRKNQRSASLVRFSPLVIFFFVFFAVFSFLYFINSFCAPFVTHTCFSFFCLRFFSSLSLRLAQQIFSVYNANALCLQKSLSRTISRAGQARRVKLNYYDFSLSFFITIKNQIGA